MLIFSANNKSIIMETKINSRAALPGFIALYDEHTKYYRNVLENVTDEDANKRLNTKANHMAWIAGSLVQERYELARLIGISGYRQTAHELFSDHKGIQDNTPYPSLAEYIGDWNKISPVLRSALGDLSDEQLQGPDPYGMPGGPYTLFQAITFCLDRESYCIGQLGLWRRLLGYPAMRYE